MASSEKPDFIEIDQREAPVKLKTGSDAAETGRVPVCEDSPGARPGQEVKSANLSALQNKPSYQNSADDSRLIRQNSPTGKPIRKLPGGTSAFVGLLIMVCCFGNQLDELRNRTLTTLATGFAIGGPGFVETVCDLAKSYRLHNNNSAAQAVLEKAIVDLSARGEDKGAQGGLLRLRLAQIAFAKDDLAQARNLSGQALDMTRRGGSYVPYDTPFEFYNTAQQFDSYWDYDQALALNTQAIDLWPNNRPNYRASVKADIGFEMNRLGKYQMAEDWFKQSLSQTMKHGDTDYNAWRLQQLGHAQLAQKKYMEAEANLNAAHEMNRTVYKNRSNIDLVQIYTDLGRLKAAKGETALAQRYLEIASVLLKTEKHDGYYYLHNQFALANLYRDTGRPAKAGPIYRELLGRLGNGEHGPDLKDVKREFDLLLAQTGGR